MRSFKLSQTKQLINSNIYRVTHSIKDVFDAILNVKETKQILKWKKQIITNLNEFILQVTV